MTIEERLKELRKDELVSLARQLNVTGYSGLDKESLIDHITDNSNEQDITVALNTDKKKGWWKRHKVAGFFIIIGFIGSIASIIALIQPPSIDPDKVAEKIAKRIPGISGEQLDRLKEKVRELETALKDEKSGNTQERKEALEALKKGNPTKAKELFKKRIEKDETNLAVNYFNLGNAYYLDLKFEEALEAYNKGIDTKKDYQDAWNNKGAALAALGRCEEAIKAYEKAIEIKPDFHEAWYNKGIDLASLGCCEEAIKAYEKAIKIKPDFHEAWNNKGIALAALGRHEEAIKACGKAIEIKPDYHEAWYNLACLYSLKKEKVKALEYFRKAIENGFNDISHIKKDKDLDFIRDEEEFKEIISKI